MSMLDALRTRMRSMITIGTVVACDGTTVDIEAQTKLVKVPLWRARGFAHRPVVGRRAIVLRIGGDGENALALIVGGDGVPPMDLQAGETALYNDFGCQLILKADGSFDFTAPSKVKITAPMVEIFAANVTINGTLTAGAIMTGALQAAPGGPMTLAGTLEVSGDVKDAGGTLDNLRTAYNGHVHSGVTSGPASTGPTSDPA